MLEEALGGAITSAIYGIIGALILYAITKRKDFIGLNRALFYAFLMSGLYALFDVEPAIAAMKGFAMAGACVLSTNYLILRSARPRQ